MKKILMGMVVVACLCALSIGELFVGLNSPLWDTDGAAIVNDTLAPGDTLKCRVFDVGKLKNYSGNATLCVRIDSLRDSIYVDVGLSESFDGTNFIHAASIGTLAFLGSKLDTLLALDLNTVPSPYIQIWWTNIGTSTDSVKTDTMRIYIQHE
jgi:hypothetical protein